MTITHHLEDATIVGLASGSLPSAFAVVAAAHAEMCPHCRKRLRAAQAVGGAFLDTVEPVPLSDSATHNLLERIGASAPRPEPALPSAAETGLPSPVAAALGAPLDAVRWRRVGPGVKIHEVDMGADDDSRLLLMHIGAGRAVPEHGHGGNEITLILTGAYRDEIGLFGPGDVADLDEDIEHQPRVEPDADCLCVVAIEAPARFKSVFGRLFQPFVGI